MMGVWGRVRDFTHHYAGSVVRASTHPTVAR